jgi:hypothetical protein
MRANVNALVPEPPCTRGHGTEETRWRAFQEPDPQPDVTLEFQAGSVPQRFAARRAIYPKAGRSGAGRKRVVAGATSSSIPLAVPFDTAMDCAVKTIKAKARPKG